MPASGRHTRAHRHKRVLEQVMRAVKREGRSAASSGYQAGALHGYRWLNFATARRRDGAADAARRVPPFESAPRTSVETLYIAQLISWGWLGRP